VDEQRPVEIERLVSDMDETRLAITRTAGELADHIRATVDWRQQALHHPAVSLGAAAVVGFMLGRLLGPALRLGGRPPRTVAPTGTAAAGILLRLASAAGLARELAFLPSLLGELARAIRPRRGPSLLGELAGAVRARRGRWGAR
jgi:hypothetical protein